MDPRHLIIWTVLLALMSCAGTRAVEPVPADGVPRECVADENGERIHYIDAGTGNTALVLIHGWACESSSWRHQIEPLAEHARVLALDLPGHGKSAEPDADCSMDLFADAVATVMDDAGVRRAVLVGHSNGTPVARQFWRRYPERTLALVAVDGALRAFMDEATLEAAAVPLREPSYRDTMAGYFGGMLAGEISAEDRDSLLSHTLDTPQDVIIESLIASGDPALWTDDPIDVPVLCVLARAPHWTEEYEAYVHGLCPDLRYELMDGVPHFLMVARPEAFNALLVDFLAENRLLD